MLSEKEENKINWEDSEKLSKRWREEGVKYASSVNQFVRIGETEGWDKAGKEPIETRKDMALDVLNIIRRANAVNDIKNLRKYFPPASLPFFSLENDEKNIFGVNLLEDNSIILNAQGEKGEKNKVYFIDTKRNIDILKNVIYVGACPNKKYFAFAYDSHIEIREGINKQIIAKLNWPTGLEGLTGEYTTNPETIKNHLEDIVVFPSGKKVLLVSFNGIFVISDKEAVRLYPDEDLMSYILRDHENGDKINIRIDMAHGAISSDGKFLAIGAQDSDHIILDDKYEIINTYEPETSYPHFAMFSKDNEHVIFNSCHFYNGCTIEVDMKNLDDDENVIIDDVCRVYAGTAREKGYIIGDANGYIHFINKGGKREWDYFIGGTISSMDICNDKLLVGTYAGSAHLINLDSREEDPYRIGNSTNIEEARFLVCGTETEILQW